MNISRFFVALGVILCLVLSPVIALIPADTAQAQPADSPWPMFRQNPQHTGRSSYIGPEVPKLKWSFATGDNVPSSPAIGADGTIYVGSRDNNLYAINPDGSQKWSFTTGSFIVNSSPAIGSDGTIYVGSDDDKLYAINPDGSQKWTFATGYLVRSSPAIGADGTIYVGSWDGKLYAINPDGSQKWSFTTGGHVDSSPAIGADGTIYVGSCDNKLYAINSDGSQKWSFATGGYVWSSPAIGADGTIYVGSYDDNLYAITEGEGYDLTISSTAGGSVTAPGEGTFPYDRGTEVDLVAEAEEGYLFVNWAGDVDTIANVNTDTTTITMQGDYEITARFMAGVVAAKTEWVRDDTVYARVEADTEVEVTGTATVTVAQYEDNPGGLAPTDFSSLGKYIDVYSPDTTEATELEIRLYYTDDELTAADIDEESLLLFWWNGTNWVQCSDSGVNTDSNYMWAKIRTSTIPSLTDLQGTPWGGYGHPTENGCFIATAAYGTDTAKEIDILREFRDAVLLPNSLGAGFVSLYYKISPPIANFISQHEVLRTAVRVVFVDPIVKILNWSHYLWSARGS